jgi:flagella basal body P-ring formation protein FlgA
MRCSSRSTRSHDRRRLAATQWAGLAALISLVVPVRTSTQALGDGARVREAIAGALAARYGDAARVHVESLMGVPVVPAGDLIAVPEPGGRTGRPTRFTLTVRDRTSGAATWMGDTTAIVTASLDFVRARRAIARGSLISDADVEAVTDDLQDAALKRPLQLVEVVGNRALRDLAPGAAITAADIAAVPTVRPGDRVRAIVRTAGIEAAVIGVVVENGTPGRVIHVVNAQSRRTIRVRVINREEVEVIDEP